MALGALAGRNRGAIFRPLRRLPAHGWHEDAGAVFEDFGGWARPAFYPLPGEARHAAEQREAMAVRNGVGLFDGSPLGKIEIKGPDAGRFLDLIYANSMSTLKVGKVRYGLMLNEQGERTGEAVPASTSRIKAGTWLVRDWGGGSHHVLVLDDGYLYRERRYRSLTSIASEITGTHWSGPRFFGLKTRAKESTVGQIA